MEAANATITTRRQNHLNLKAAHALNEMLPALCTAAHAVADNITKATADTPKPLKVVCVQAVGEADAQLRHLNADIIVSTDHDLLLFNGSNKPVLLVTDLFYFYKDLGNTYAPPPVLSAQYNDHLTMGEAQLLYAALLISDYPDHHISGIGFQTVYNLMGRRGVGAEAGCCATSTI